MFLVSRIIQSFVETIEEDDMHRIEHMGDDDAMGYLCDLYEDNYAAQPSGVAMFLIKTKFKLAVEVPQLA